MILASRNDPPLFGAIFERHFDAIHRYLRRRVGETLADDLAAQVFTEAFARRAKYDPSRPDARPWLYGIAANLLRRHRREETRRLRAYARTGVDPDVVPDLAAVHARVDADYARRALAEALAALNPRDRETLFLHAWAELSYADIGAALGVPIGTVRSRLHRARRFMRERLERDAARDDNPSDATYVLEAIDG